MTRRRVLALTAFAFALILPQVAQAHLVSTRFGDFYDGMVHPVTAFEHIVPWLALGLLAGLQPMAGRWMLLAFPLGVAAGAAAAMALPDIALVSAANLASLMVLGALVALAWPLPAWALATLAAAFGTSHGFANGAAMADATNATLFIPGVVVAGYLVLLLMAAVTTALLRKWDTARVAVRALGSWIFALGVMMIGASLA